MLSFFVFLFGFFPGPQHLVHALWYFIRSRTLEDEPVKVDFPVSGELSRSFMDVLYIPLTTVFLTVPEPSVGDFVFVPYFVHHVMGYVVPVWFSVFPGAFFTMYMSHRPEVLFCMFGAMSSREVRGDHRRLGVFVSAVVHAVLAGVEFVYMDMQFSVISVFLVVCMAECKLRLNWGHEVMPPFGNLLAMPVYVLNYFMLGWEHVWKYTDKVWLSMDITYLVFNAVGAYAIRKYMYEVNL